MRDKLSLTYQLNMAVRITFVLSLCLWRVALAAPDCTLIDNVLNCKITTNEDFGNLSSVAEDISLQFTDDNTVAFQDSLFPYLPVLRTLTVDLRYINDLSTGAFKLLSTLENLQFDNSDIYRPLPELFLKSGTLEGLGALKTLNITENGITLIENGAFQDLTQLTHLVMIRNGVSSLPNSLFAATKLESLILADMELTQLTSTTFQGLEGLKVFQFTHSKLQTLDASLFREMPNLQEINLERNELTSLTMDIFKGLTSLNELNLRNSKNLTNLPYGFFNDLTQLVTLDVSFSGVEIIEDRIFENLGLLKYLKLTDNRIQTISSNTFNGLASLQSLELENNAITAIPADALSDSPNVLITHFYNNEIREIDPLAFNGTDLSILTLYGNKLTKLPDGVFDSLKNMNHIDVSNNPWQCDCGITWLKSWIEKQPPYFVLENSATTVCDSPIDKQGNKLQQHIENAFNDCLPTTTTSTTITTTSTAIPTQTTENSTTVAIDPTGNDQENSGTSKTTITVIIVACILVALIIIVVVVIAMYCRHRKYAFWAPPQTAGDEPDGKKPPNDLKYLARHQIGSFYQNPDTYSISAMWETDSTASEPRYSIEPGANRDSIKNRYVYENPALDLTDTNDNSVVVVDTNGTSVTELPLSVTALPVNGRLHSSSETVPSPRTNVSPVPAHGYGPGKDHTAVSIPSYDQVDGETLEHYQMNSMAPSGDYSPGSESPRAHSISSISDDGSEQLQEPETWRDNRDLHAVVDPPHLGLTLPTEASNTLQDDYEHLNKEPSSPSSAHDYLPIKHPEEPTGPIEGLQLNVKAQDPGDYEHLQQPHTPPSPHDYVGIQINRDPRSDVPEVHGSSTDAHGGTAAYNNSSYYDSDN